VHPVFEAFLECARVPCAIFNLYWALLLARGPRWTGVMAAVYACISAFLSYRINSGLTKRWLVKYSRIGLIVRLVSFNSLSIGCTSYLRSLIKNDTELQLPLWILVSCLYTLVYTVELWVTSNIDSGRKGRHLNLYEIAIYGVAPLGMASFVCNALALAELRYWHQNEGMV